jgi:hypothetical protein
VNNVEILSSVPVNRFATWCFWDCCVRAKGEGKFAGVEERAVLGRRDDMLVVTKSAAAGEAMKFLGGVGGFGVRRVWGITWPNLRETGVRVVYRGNYVVFGHAF